MNAETISTIAAAALAGNQCSDREKLSRAAKAALAVTPGEGPLYLRQARAVHVALGHKWMTDTVIVLSTLRSLGIL